MLCAFPAGVVECQCPRFTVAALEKMDACPPDTRASDSPPSSCSSISMEIKKRQRKKGMLDLSMLEDREAQTKEAIWSVRNQIPFWDVFNTLPPPHQKHQTSKKMFFWLFFTAKWCTKKKKTFAGEEVRPSDAAPLPLNAPYFSCQYTPSIHFHLADTFYWPGDE